MKQLPAGLQAHLDSGATTLAWCWKLTRSDGVVMGFTDHDRDISFDGVTFAAASGFTASEIASSLGLAIDNLEVAGALSSVQVTEADLAAGLYDGAGFELWRVNWAEVSQRLLMRRGSLGEVSRGEIAFTAELRGLAHELQQAMGRTYQRLCDAEVGDGRCGFNLDLPGFSGSGSIVASIDDRVLTVSGLSAFSEHWFGFGRLTWTSGQNSGWSAEIKSHRVGSAVTLELWQRAPRSVQEGDTFTVKAGCDKTFGTCKAKFNNVANFRGFPHMPGNDRAFGYVVKESGEHDGGSFFR